MYTSQNSLPNIFIGIDIHKRSWKIHTATELFDGKSFNIEPDSFQLKRYIDEHYKKDFNKSGSKIIEQTFICNKNRNTLSNRNCKIEFIKIFLKSSRTK